MALLARYGPAVALLAVTFLVIDWRVAVHTGKRYGVWKRLPGIVVVSVVVAVAMYYTKFA